MASIGDLFLKVVADMSGFETDVTSKAAAAGDKAGQTLGARIGSGVKNTLAVGIGVAAGAAALAFGVAAKGALELQNAIADYQAATGASAIEAQNAGKTINRVAGEELLSLQAVTDIAIKVKNDLHAVGPEADYLTQAFARFARVTKQDGAAAVDDFHKIIDAWNLSASDTVDLMDKLLVSTQRFGGSITDRQAGLAAIAPTMQAANMSIDDGIGLLNLFEAAGIDASKAPAALAHAIKLLKPGQNLDDLIRQISSIQDPTLRAQKAMQIFGTKGGVALAQALKPGITSLKDFEISTNDAAGATTKAADIIDSTWSGRIRKAISEAEAQLRQFGTDLGPGASLLGALGSVVGPLLGPSIEKASTAAWTRVASSAVVKAAALRAGEAAATAYLTALIAGDFVVGALTGAWAAVAGSAILAPIIARAGSAAATAYLTGLIAIDTIGGALAGAFAAVGITGAVTAGADALGTLLGSRIGLGLKLGIVGIVAEIADLIHGPLTDLGKNIHEALLGHDGPLDQIGKALDPDTLPWPLGNKDAPDWAKFKQDNTKGLDTAIVQPLIGTSDRTDKVAYDLAKRVGVAANSLAVGFESMADRGVNASNDLTTGLESMARGGETAADTLSRAIASNVGKIKTKITELRAKLITEAQAMITGYYDPLIAQDDLMVQKDQVAADKKALAATKAGTAERHQAQLTLDQSQYALDQTRANLLASGQLTGKEQKDWLSDLQKRYKTATGAAKTYLQGLMTEIEKFQGLDHAGITITVKGLRASGTSGFGRAAGGPVQAGVPYMVGEHRPELFVPDVNGRILPTVPAAVSTGASAGTTISLTVNAGSDVSPLAARRLGQTILDTIAEGLRDQTARSGTR